jgi:hypothetical protein
MMLDSLCQLDNAHAYTATAVSTNVLGPRPAQPCRATRPAISAPASRCMLSILVTTTVTDERLDGVHAGKFGEHLADLLDVHWTGPTVLSPRWSPATGTPRASSSRPAITSAMSASA